MKNVLILLWLTWGFAFAQPLDKPTTQEQKNGHKQQAKEQNYSPVPPLFFVQQFSPEHYAAAREKEQWNTDKEERRHRETLKVAADTLQASDSSAETAKFAVLVAAIAAVIAWAQYWMFHEQLGIMRDSNKAIGATIESAEKKAMPILLPSVIGHDLIWKHEGDFVSYSPAVEIAFDNFGETPAIIVESKFVLAIIDFGDGIPNEANWTFHRKGTAGEIVAGNYRVAMTDIGTLVDTGFDIDQDTEAALKAKAKVGILASGPVKRFFLYGRVVYDDIFGWQHERGFGRRLFLTESGNVHQVVRGAKMFEYYHRYNRKNGEKAKIDKTED